MNQQEYVSLKAKVEQLKKATHQAQGALAFKMQQLHKLHGCKTIEEAKVLLAEKKAELIDEEEDYEIAVKAFKKKWKDVL
jgi:hypothetical protein